jgi:hypothetical protein
MKRFSLKSGKDLLLLAFAGGGLLASLGSCILSVGQGARLTPARVGQAARLSNLDPPTTPVPPPGGRVEEPPPPAPRPAPAARPAPPAPPPVPVAWQRPEVPRHYPHIRIALLAYSGNPMGAFEDRLLRESVDLVVPNAAYLKHIHGVAPNTPQLLYTNTSNLYLDLLTDWLTYADAQGHSREGAFYHAARPIGFRGDSPSSQPVTWFWGVYRGGRSLHDVTSAAHGKGSQVRFPHDGESLYAGYPERFREVHVQLAAPAGDGWAVTMEYARAVDDDGRPAAWGALPTREDTTGRLARSGQLAFDPPADWKPASVGGSARLFYVRFRTTSDGTAPAASGLLGRDYVGAHGTTSGTVPVFDEQADANGDGYLDDAEYARRSPGKDARFRYESRLFTETYGQMRYSTHPSDAGFRAWCVEHHRRLLQQYPLATGLFMDNSGGKVPVRPGDVLEPVTHYGEDLGALLRAVREAAAPRLVLANTVGGYANAESVIRQNPAYFEEFAIRPLSHPWSFFEELAGMVAKRSTLTDPPPYAVLDSHPQKGEQLDPRLQLGTLAYYYLLADPDSTFLMLYGGVEPNTPWQRHWVPAAAFDVGRPREKWSVLASGPDPAKPVLTYKVYQRPYEKALVLFKPLSYARGVRETASSGEDTATRHDPGGTYRPLRADGSLGDPVTSVTLRNGEGSILVKGE